MIPVEQSDSLFFSTYRRIPVQIDRGDGVYLFSTDGTRYLDMFAGIGVNALGYNHPGLLAAIREQSGKYTHLSNFFLQEPQIRLAAGLLNATGYSRVFFCNSGAEAVEGAIKIARKYGSGQGRTGIVSFTRSFHGRTIGALSLMDNMKYRSGYGPFLSDCHVIPFNDTGQLHNNVSERTAAVVLEFIQGEGGIRPATGDFVKAIENLRGKYGFLLIADEVQAGIGRTGKLFSFEHFGIKPDIVVAAKPLGGGLPLGAILGNSKVASVLAQGTHGSTFGGNPVACAAGAVLLTEVTEGGLLSHVVDAGDYLGQGLRKLAKRFPDIVREVRGYGLMMGVDLGDHCEEIVEALRRKHILSNFTDRTVMRIVPPLIIGKEHLKEFLRTFSEVLSSRG